jgi:hypothetical protein
MPGLVHDIRVFIASPSGLEIEREAFRETLQEFNELDLQGRRVIFTPYGWELTLGGFGRPQELINKDLADCHYFILVLWDRWGSPPDAEGKFTSGCEEEFDLAVRCLKDAKRPMRQMVVFFKESADGRPVDAEQIEKSGLSGRNWIRVKSISTTLSRTLLLFRSNCADCSFGGPAIMICGPRDRWRFLRDEQQVLNPSSILKC